MWLTYQITYTESFWEDLKTVIDWYDSVSSSLADKFIAELSFAELSMAENPTAYGRVRTSKFRRITLLKFPYKIFFRVEQQSVFVIAIVHMSRSNKYVKRRLK